MKISIPSMLCFVSFVFSPLATGLLAEKPTTGFDPFPDYFDKPETLSGGVDRGEVTIPYAEMKRMWEELREKPKEPEKEKAPINFVVAAAEYTLAVSAGKSQLVADFQIRVFNDEWQVIPLIGGEVGLEQVEAAEGSIVRRDGGYALMVKGKGEHQVKLTLRAPGIASWPNFQGFQLQVAAASLARFRVSGLPADQAMRLQEVDSGAVVKLTASEGGADYHLAGGGGKLTLVLEPDSMVDAPVVESVWGIQSQMFVRYGEGSLHYEAHVFAQSDAGSGLSMDLVLPQNVASVLVDGEDMASWRLERNPDGKRELRITWKTRDQLDRRFQLSYQIAQSPLADRWTIAPPEVAGEGKAAKHLIAMETVEGLEWKGEGVSGAVASRRLPEWLRGHLKELEFVTVETQGPLEIEANWLPVLEAMQATVSRAKFETRLVNDGAMLVQAEYHVQQRGGLDWRVNIPASVQILTCEVDGKAVKPVRRNENELEFHLKTPAPGKKSGDEGTVVGFSYALQSAAFDPVSGQVTVELPQTGLFIHRLDWDLEIPEIYDAEVEGNVQQTSGHSSTAPNKKDTAGGHSIRLHKELCRGEQPAVEVHYRRRGIDE